MRIRKNRLHGICQPIAVLLLLSPALFAQTSELYLVSGNGQVVTEQFLTTQPMVVQARDSAGNPVAGVTVNWAITQGSGTIVRPSTVTDANGYVSANFLGTALQAGYSFAPATVTASTATSSVDFIVTTVLLRLPNGGPAAPPLVELLVPKLGDTVSGPAGSVVQGAIQVRVTAESGPQSGVPVPNVGIFVQDASDSTAKPLGACNGPGGTLLTDSNGVATCDLVLGPTTGSEQVLMAVGGFQNTRTFTLTVTPGQNCSYTLSPASQAFGASGGMSTVSIGAAAGCGWTAVSNAAWITLGATTSGNGNGSVTYTVAANPGPARTGTITIAGKTETITQSAAGTANPLVLTTTSLPSGFVGTTYSVGISATGGTPPYSWSSSGSLPPGLSLSASAGVISGTPSTAGVYPFSITVKDSTGASASQLLTLTVTGPGSGGGSLGILSTVFPNAVVGTAYRQALTTSGGCVTPFSPTPVFSLASGQLPPGIAINQVAAGGYVLSGTPTTAGDFKFTLAAKDACGTMATAAVTLTVSSSSGGGNPGGIVLSASPSTLTFTMQAGGTAPSQIVSLSTSSGSVNFTASASASWLSVTATGSAPATIQVSVLNTSGLTAGSYQALVTIVSGASNSPTNIPVTLTIQAAPTLIPSPASLKFSLQTSGGSTTSQQTVAVSASSAVQFSASTVGFAWLSVTPDLATVPATLTVTANSAGLAAGTYTGAITLTPPSGGVQIVTVTLTVTVPPAITAAPPTLAFSYQQGTNPPAPQTVELTSTATGSLSVTLATTSKGGDWLSAGSSSLNAPGSIAVAVNPAGLSPGSYTGTITITPSNSAIVPISVAVSLTVTAAPPAVTAVTNAASFATGPVAPGEIVVIFGTSFGPSTLVPTSVTAAGLLDTTLGQTRVLFDNVPAPMVYAVAGQVSAIVPYGVAVKSSTVMQVEYNGVLSQAVSLQVAATSPAVFTLNSGGQGAILNQDTSVNGSQNGAAPGSIISIYATGAGVMDPAAADGSVTSVDVLPKPKGNVSVTIGGMQAEVLYAGAAPLAPSGLLQVNARIPDGVARGQSVPVFLTVGSATSMAVVTVAIAP